MSDTTYSVISADSHVIEPHDLWSRRGPAKFRDRVPKIATSRPSTSVSTAGARSGPI